MTRPVKEVVSRAIAAAANYFVVQQNMSFKEIGDKLQMFLTAILSQEEDFNRVSCMLHEHPEGHYYDIGIVIGEMVAMLRLEEVERGKPPVTTLH